MRIIIIVLLAFVVCDQCYGQKISYKMQNELICTTIHDFNEMCGQPESESELLISSELASPGSNERLLKLCLAEKGIGSNATREIYSVRPNTLNLSECKLLNVKVIKDKTVMDSLSFLHFISVSDTTSPIFSMDTTLIARRLDSLHFTAIYIGSPKYYKNYAVISIKIADNEACYLYKLKRKKWVKEKIIYDPR